jgi:hypothetical protein
MNCTPIQIVAIAFFLLQPAVLSPMKISPEKAGKGDQTLPLRAGSYQTDEGSEKEVGTKEIKKPDGRKDEVYYSTTAPEEEAERRQEEKEKVEKSLDILRNIIIIPKRTQ